MALENFIPEIWAGDVLQALQKATVFGSLVNRNWEGEIANGGDTVRLTQIGSVTIGNYAKNTDMADPETLVDSQQVMQITESKYFNFQIDKIDLKQGNPKVLAAAMDEASYGLRDEMDQFIAGQYTGAAAANLIGTTASPKLPNNTAGNANNVYKLVTDCRKALVKQNVPSGGWWMVVNPDFYGILLNEDKFIEADKAGTGLGLRQGQVCSIKGFPIFESNNLEFIEDGDGSHDVYKAMFGTNAAITFADQINNVEQYSPEKRFAAAVKGLHLYGAKVVRPQCLGVLSYYTT